MRKEIDWIKKHKRLIIMLSITVYIIIPILPFIKSPIGFIQKNDAVIFLQYYGTIISGITGGALTLGGVWWTIDNNRKVLKEEKRIEFMPILKTELDINGSTFKNNKICIKFILKNVGRGEAWDVDYDHECYILDNKKNKKISYPEIQCIQDNISLILPEESYSIIFYYNYDESLLVKSNYIMYHVFTFKYKDLYRDKEYNNFKYQLSNSLYGNEIGKSLEISVQIDETNNKIDINNVKITR